MLRTCLLLLIVVIALLPAVASQAQTCLGATEVYSIGFESGTGGWVQSGTNGTWVLTNARSKSGAISAYSPAAETVAEEFLFSAQIAVPPGPTQLRFWQWQEIEDRTGSPDFACWDGGVVEISNQGGGDTYQRLDDEILSNPYDGVVSDTTENALGGQRAWCGDPRDWTETVVDITEYSDSDIFVRYRLSTDSSIGREGWYVDDVVVETCDPAAEHLVAYYPFDGAGTDFSGRNQDSTLQGAASFTEGRYGQALDLRSASDAWVDLPALLADETACTFAAWLQYDTLDPATFGDLVAVFAHDGFEPGDLHFNLRLQEAPIGLEFHLQNTARVAWPGPATPTDFFHVAMTYDSIVGESRLYIDGRLVSVQPQSSVSCGNGDVSQIGAWDFDGGGFQTRFFKGLVDDVRIYNTALSAEQILQLAPDLFADGFESGDLTAWDAVVP